MKTIPHLALAAAGALLLAGCETLAPRPAAPLTEVVRAHSGQPIAPATIALSTPDLARAADPIARSYLGAVGHELGRLGFTPVREVGRAELLGTVSVATGTPERLAAAAPTGLRGDQFAPAAGMATGMIVQIRRRSDGLMIWQGRAMTRIPPGVGDLSTLALPMARALFSGFPGESGRTIRSR